MTIKKGDTRRYLTNNLESCDPTPVNQRVHLTVTLSLADSPHSYGKKERKRWLVIDVEDVYSTITSMDISRIDDASLKED